MSATNVDIVFVIDASDSMKPCFEQVRQHLGQLLKSLGNFNGKLRFGLVAQSVGVHAGKAIYDYTFVGGKGPDIIPNLYSAAANYSTDNLCFTESKDVFLNVLKNVNCMGNEDMLVALDIALDFPFGPIQSTKRVVALFTDERFEDGIALEERNEQIPQLIDKIHARHIQFFCAGPESPALDELAAADRSEVDVVDEGSGLAGIDFGQMLGQMGKSISVSSLQKTAEPPYTRAVFGQDTWGAERFISESNRSTVLAQGESASLNMSQPIEWIRAKLDWTAAVDLDLHAFYRSHSLGGQNNEKHHVYYAKKKIGDVELDFDAGIGDVSGKNQENLTIKSLAHIEEILFATKIYKKGGCFADYDGRVVVTTSNGDDITVPLTAQQKGDWCIIASINNTNPSNPTVINVNRVQTDEPET